jgi:hypothetical protein
MIMLILAVNMVRIPYEKALNCDGVQEQSHRYINGTRRMAEDARIAMSATPTMQAMHNFAGCAREEKMRRGRL